MTRTCALAFLISLAAALPVAAHGKTMAETPLQKKIHVAGKAVVVRYLLYLPPGYRRQAGRRWPLILFLHGSTERGSNPDILERNGLPAHLEKAGKLPFIVISPQLPLEQDRWDPVALKALLNAVLPELRADRDRMYLTGWSLGGNGVWRMASRYPGLFAAVAPVAGWGSADMARALRNVPAWIFHGAKDTNVLPRQSASMAEALRRAGDEVKFTLYPGLDHDCWRAVYKDQDLYAWFLKHHRPRTAAPAGPGLARRPGG